MQISIMMIVALQSIMCERAMNGSHSHSHVAASSTQPPSHQSGGQVKWPASCGCGCSPTKERERQQSRAEQIAPQSTRKQGRGEGAASCCSSTSDPSYLSGHVVPVHELLPARRDAAGAAGRVLVLQQHPRQQQQQAAQVVCQGSGTAQAAAAAAAQAPTPDSVAPVASRRDDGGDAQRPAAGCWQWPCQSTATATAGGGGRRRPQLELHLRGRPAHQDGRGWQVGAAPGAVHARPIQRW